MMMMLIMIVMIVFMKRVIHCLMLECSSVSVEKKRDEGMRQRRGRTDGEAEKPWWDEDFKVQILLNGGSEPIFTKLLTMLEFSERQKYTGTVLHHNFFLLEPKVRHGFCRGTNFVCEYHMISGSSSSISHNDFKVDFRKSDQKSSK